jgi:C4-dicarboxylate-specific signal transduction histidine kinase
MQHKILIADDDLTSRELVRSICSDWGYKVLSAKNGHEAIHLLEVQPDIEVAILDWIMPDYTGLEICNNYSKRKDHLTHLILLSGKADIQDVINGLDSGADDYMTKPFEPLELLARIRSGIRSFQMKSLIYRYANNMEKLAEEKAEQLVHADRLSTLGVLSSGMAHEVNNPLGFIRTNLQFLQDCQPMIIQALDCAQNTSSVEQEQLEYCKQELEPTLKGIQTGIERISTIISGLKQYARRDTSEKTPFDLRDAIENSLQLTNSRLKNQVEVVFDKTENPAVILGNKQRIEQVFINLLINAADAMKNTQEPKISIQLLNSPKTAASPFFEILFSNNGPCISSQAISKIFTPFFTTKATGEGTGLGLAISQGIISEHKGTIQVRNIQNRQKGTGVTFTIRLPQGQDTI